MLSTTIKRTIATTLSGAAIAGSLSAPAAQAMPSDPVHTDAMPNSTWVPPIAPTSDAPAAVESAPDPGFDLSSAAIGAAAGTGLLIVLLAAGGLAWRPATARRHGAAGV